MTNFWEFLLALQNYRLCVLITHLYFNQKKQTSWWNLWGHLSMDHEMLQGFCQRALVQWLLPAACQVQHYRKNRYINVHNISSRCAVRLQEMHVIIQWYINLTWLNHLHVERRYVCFNSPSLLCPQQLPAMRACCSSSCCLSVGLLISGQG